MNGSYIKEIYLSLNHLSGDRLGILINAVRSFSKTKAAQASASLAYYTIFSIFPLLIVLIASGSYFLDSHEVFGIVTQLVQQVLPISRQVINDNLRIVLDERGTVGIIGLITLLWSASGMFTNLAHNINLAWPHASRRNFLQSRLAGLSMIAGLIGLILLSLILGWVTSLLPFANVANAPPSDLRLLALFSSFGSWLMIFLVFLTLYHWIPTVRVKRNATFWGALIAASLWKLATAGFGWYLDSGFGRYQLVYGSLGAIVAFLFLIYIISLITLFGAHLSAAIDGWEKLETLR